MAEMDQMTQQNAALVEHASTAAIRLRENASDVEQVMEVLDKSDQDEGSTPLVKQDSFRVAVTLACRCLMIQSE